jgi:hypothetical protein
MADDDALNKFAHALGTWMEESLGVHESFLSTIHTDDDWTFILKIHAIVEAGLNQMILNHFAEPRISRIITKLQIGNSGTGKLAFAKALDLIPLESREFISVLSDIRNFCIHDVKNFDFDLKSYVKSLPLGKLDEFLRTATFSMLRSLEIPDFSITEYQQTITDNPRLGILSAGIGFLGDVIIHQKQCQLRDATAEVQRLQAEEFHRSSESSPTEQA